jgi:glycosyltransferase involved in cell wall biosynthesis
MKRVAVFRSELLPISETFIRDQVMSLRSWHPTLLGLFENPGGIAPQGTERRVAGAYRLRAALPLWAAASGRMQMLLRQSHAQLVHAHFGTDACDIWPHVKRLEMPLLVTLHGYDINIERSWWETGNGGWRRRSYPRRLLEMARDPLVNFVSVSDSIRRRAIDYGIPESKVRTSYIGVDVDRFTPGDSRPSRKNILFVGRMVEKKAPGVLIRAFAIAQKKVPDCTLTMVGDGPLLSSSKALCRELDVQVEFTGSRSADEILQHLRSASVFCLPSITAKNGDAEGLPISILEAMACGIPVITSAKGAVGEAVIHGLNGFCFPENDVESLANQMIYCVTSNELAIELGKAGAAIARERFNMAALTRRLEREFYDRVIADGTHVHD